MFDCQATLAQNPMLYIRPSSWFFKFLVFAHRGRVCPGSVGTRQALLQGWILCRGFVCLANVPNLVRWLIGAFHLFNLPTKLPSDNYFYLLKLDASFYCLLA